MHDNPPSGPWRLGPETRRCIGLREACTGRVSERAGNTGRARLQPQFRLQPLLQKRRRMATLLAPLFNDESEIEGVCRLQATELRPESIGIFDYLLIWLRLLYW